MTAEIKIMRDVFIEELYKRMHSDKKIFFLCADFGSPKLDKLKVDFKDRFINVGIAEQNLINVSTGLALEGFTVYAYAIAPFLTMRAYEQIRNNISLYAQLKDININLIGVGAGLSYDVSGPTHHCLEDISIMRTLPNITVFSPSDWVLTKEFVTYSIEKKKPKYIRLDGKPLPSIYHDLSHINLNRGFSELKRGNGICLVSTGYMTHKALKIADLLSKEHINIGVIDSYMLRPIEEDLLCNILRNYQGVVTFEEGFINRGGLDSLVLGLIDKKNLSLSKKMFGFDDAYVFGVGTREYLHKLNRLDEATIIDAIKLMLKTQ